MIGGSLKVGDDPVFHATQESRDRGGETLRDRRVCAHQVRENPSRDPP